MSKRIFSFAVMILLGVIASWADTAIPLTTGTYLVTSESTTTGTINNNDNGNLGGIYGGATATFTLTNAAAQDMVLYFLTGSNNNAAPKVSVTLNDGTSDLFTKTVDVEVNGSWPPSIKHIFDLGTVPAGTLTLTFGFSNNGGYVCNVGSIGLYAKDDFNATMDVIPGSITLTKGTYNGPKTENNGANVGYVQNGGKAAYAFYSSMEGGYDLSLDIYRYNQGGTMNVKIQDLSTGSVEYNDDYTIASTAPGAYTTNTINIPSIAAGYKTMTFTFSDGSSYICNYKNIEFAYTGTAAEFTDYTVTGQTVTAGTETDYLCNLPVAYDATTTFGIGATNGTLAVTAVDSNNSAVSVTDNGDDTYTVATPALNDYVIVTATLTPDAGATTAKTTSTLKLFRIGEMSLTAITVDGTNIDVLDDINDSSTSYTATYGACYTTAPVIAATQVDGEAATVSAPVISGSTYTYTIHGAIGGTDIERDYTLVLNNVHVYTPAGGEKSVNIKNNEGTRENNTWTNGIYTFSTTSLDGYNQYFKLNGNSYTLSLPADVVVKQLIFKDASNNYAGNDARVVSVTSTGATAYIPVDNKYYHESEGAKHDIIVNIDNHSAGNDIIINQPKSGQPMAWIQLTIINQDPGTAPQRTAENVNVVNNHAVVTLTFDREIPSDVNANINGNVVTAKGGSAVLVFPIWNLDYSTDYTMTIPVGNVVDSYGNSNAEAINVAVNTEAKPAVAKVTYDYVVSDAAELDAALAELKVSNKTADATRKTVFLKNGSYTYGTLVGSYQYNVSLKIDNWNDVYNVSLIGESKDGVIIEGTTDGITSSTLNLGNGTGIYVQDMTIRNNYDYPTADKGVSVAVTGGNKAVLKNVAMQACQDTYVTGKRTYLENCDIYGTVDFICGGGDIFFKECDLILLYRQQNTGDVIVAPNTTADTKWGYVFQGCNIKAREGDDMITDGNYTLGRPWQNEPRAYYLNTTMNVLPTDNGWSGMSNLYTHFYEYNSMDGNGDALDLSVRGNSSSSLNTYTPVLTDAEAAAYTVENVLGGTDSWLPTEATAQTAAPVLAASISTLSWAEMDDARCYVIFKDGEYLDNVTTLSYEVTDYGIYTVCAANLNGGLGLVSNEVEVNGTVILDETVDYTPVAAEDVDVTLRRTVTAGKWSTIVLPFAMTEAQLADAFGSDVKVAELSTGSSEESLSFTTVTATEANKPYAIKVTTNFTEAVINGVTIVEAEPVQAGANWNFVGTYSAGTMATGSFYFSNNQLKKAGATGTHSIKPFRAYFTYAGGGEAPNSLDFTVDKDEATVIYDVNDNANVNNADATIHTISGQRVSHPVKGINIVNGMKYVK